MLALLILSTAATIGSWSAWSVTDANNNNSFSTNTILIDDNQGGEGGSAISTGTAMFTVNNLEPGSASTTACIGVDFSGSAPVSTLTLSAALGGAGQATLQNQLTLNTAQYNTSGTVTVTPGTNTNSGSCANYPSGGTNTTVGTQGATLSSWAGSGPYSIASPVTNTWYKFTISGLPAGDTNCVTYCNQTITVALTWTLTTT
ncbi:MAG TPA: hypothetical protein VEI83_07705 [Acidimicrobiales bacterium]|nr:hypothetical protein [Acidimicrobiales bacterium]